MRIRSRWARGAAMVCALVLAAAAGAGEDLGTFHAWRAHTFIEGKQLVCSMWSQPEKSEGDYTRRGEVFAFVTHRPAEKRLHKVSFEIGYDFKAKTPLVVDIGGKAFKLVTNGSTAWSESPDENRALVALMKAGDTMKVVGYSRRGTRTTDTYSLRGFSAAYRKISAACKVP